ncbi:hypothetical protein FE391_26060 [Nonomuraea sp. KC401]|uniref:hypothetical protein n=1 Tax=unclassified Nonomuraea TaxID=2593643 RepID=UPI0010FDA883|nr:MULTISPECIES: hypothetical protein [unclassified Nonomuraea]NBE97219.1 hypothetical protein [Nonomuraea sp. K271]TLF65918.1 hypothetical protein FE391_26060 [Nonomuraea sp. KC401]
MWDGGKDFPASQPQNIDPATRCGAEWVRARIQAELGRDAVITGWSYRLLSVEERGSAAAAVRAAAGGIGDRGNVRMLLVVEAEALDPVADADALALLAGAPAGSRVAYEIAYRVRGGLLGRLLGPGGRSR